MAKPFTSPKEVIPHRSPFLYLDEVIELSLKDPISAKGVWTPTSSHEFFQGHFPANPILPGVLMIEAMAQLGAYLLLSNEEYKDCLPLFAGIDKARFRQQVLPDVKLDIEIELVNLSKKAGKGKGRVLAEGKKACEADLMFFCLRNDEAGIVPAKTK